MTMENNIAVVVHDRDIRDLICLNLRFESFNTKSYDDVGSFLKSKDLARLAIIDVSGESEPSKTVKKVRDLFGDKFHILLMTDRGTPSLEGERELLIEKDNGRKRFDAVELITRVKDVFETADGEVQQHPLTGLPAGTLVERHINTLIAARTDFALISTDLDNMKAFNQRFGYACGDTLLKRTVSLIQIALSGFRDELNYVGHRGEDDFVIITSLKNARAIGEKIVDGFDEMIEEFFNEEEKESGYFTVSDSRGNELQFPKTTVSVVIVSTVGRFITHPAELFDIADVIMTQVKSRGINQSYCVVESRNPEILPESY